MPNAFRVAQSLDADWTMVVDHGNNEAMDRQIMESMPISKFKATCLAALERVRRTGRPLQVTRFGKPVAEILPPTPPPATRNWLGDMRGTAAIAHDITGPSSALVGWEATK